MSEKPAFVEEYAGVPVRIYKSVFHVPEKLPSVSGLNLISSMKQVFVSLFLPQGYPYTVSEDYTEYQIWDTIQAFASSLNGALSTAAILKGVGVGNQEATVLAASLTWILKDGTGMIGRIVFAWAKGTELDSNCKKWRLIADVLNDMAFGLDILASHVPRTFFGPLSCSSSSLRAIVGVAGGATRTCVTRHQAKRENLADVAAKDGSQETLVNVVSLLVSLLMLPAVDQNPVLVWILSITFTVVHIYANYRAVRSLKFDTLNQKRLNYCIRKFVVEHRIPDVSEGNEAEPLFWNLGPWRKFGCSLSEVTKVDKNLQKTTLEPKHGRWIASYVVEKNKGFVALKSDSGWNDQLDAAIAVEFRAESGNWPSSEVLTEFKEKMKKSKWNLEFGQLEYDEWRFREKNE